MKVEYNKDFPNYRTKGSEPSEEFLEIMKLYNNSDIKSVTFLYDTDKEARSKASTVFNIINRNYKNKMDSYLRKNKVIVVKRKDNKND